MFYILQHFTVEISVFKHPFKERWETLRNDSPESFINLIFLSKKSLQRFTYSEDMVFSKSPNDLYTPDPNAVSWLVPSLNKIYSVTVWGVRSLVADMFRPNIICLTKKWVSSCCCRVHKSNHALATSVPLGTVYSCSLVPVFMKSLFYFPAVSKVFVVGKLSYSVAIDLQKIQHVSLFSDTAFIYGVICSL